MNGKLPLQLQASQNSFYNCEIMVIISSREFREHQKKYFDLVDQNEQVVVQRGKDKAYVLVPVNHIDRLSVNEELIQTVQEAEAELSYGKTTQVKDSGNIWESIL